MSEECMNTHKHNYHQQVIQKVGHIIDSSGCQLRDEQNRIVEGVWVDALADDLQHKTKTAELFPWYRIAHILF